MGPACGHWQWPGPEYCRLSVPRASHLRGLRGYCTLYNDHLRSPRASSSKYGPKIEGPSREDMGPLREYRLLVQQGEGGNLCVQSKDVSMFLRDKHSLAASVMTNKNLREQLHGSFFVI